MVLASDDGRNLDKVGPVLSLIVFMFYNKNLFEQCVKLGLFDLLLKLFLNLKNLDYMIVNNNQKVPVNQRLKWRAVENTIHAFNSCYNIVREQHSFNKISVIKGEEFESITVILQLLEEESADADRVDLILSMLLRLFNLAYNPESHAVEAEEFVTAVQNID